MFPRSGLRLQAQKSATPSAEPQRRKTPTTSASVLYAQTRFQMFNTRRQPRLRPHHPATRQRQQQLSPPVFRAQHQARAMSQQRPAAPQHPQVAQPLYADSRSRELVLRLWDSGVRAVFKNGVPRVHLVSPFSLSSYSGPIIREKHPWLRI